MFFFENRSYQYKTPHYSLLPQKVAKSAKVPTIFDSFPPFFKMNLTDLTKDSSGKVSMGKHHRMAPAFPCLGSWLPWMEGALPRNALFPGVALGGCPEKLFVPMMFIAPLIGFLICVLHDIFL